MHSLSLSQSPPPCPQGQAAEQNVDDPIVLLLQAAVTQTSVVGDILNIGP